MLRNAVGIMMIITIILGGKSSAAFPGQVNCPSGNQDNYEVHDAVVSCANSATVHIHQTEFYDQQKVEYQITNDATGVTYEAELKIDQTSQYTFTMKNETGKELLHLSGFAPSIDEIVQFLDANRDGFLDINIVEQEGALNSWHAIYLWDNSTQSYVKVNCSEKLSYTEAYDGYLLNWAKDDWQSGIIQKFIWNGNNLVKESEERYLAADS